MFQFSKYYSSLDIKPTDKKEINKITKSIIFQHGLLYTQEGDIVDDMLVRITLEEIFRPKMGKKTTNDNDG